MSTETTALVVYALTALAGLVIVLTRLRLGGGKAAGHSAIAGGVVRLHTVVGGLALVLWLVFLFAPLSEDTSSLVGIAALFLWWVLALLGVLILFRWLPTRGRHAAAGAEDSWSDGPGLSLLAHVGMVVGVAVFTYAYLWSKV